MNEKDEQDYPRIAFENESAFSAGREKLEERVKKAVDLVSKCGMKAERLEDAVLENVVFDVFNFPMSSQHKIRRDLTEYGEVPPILERSKVSGTAETPQGKGGSVASWIEVAVNSALRQFELQYGTRESERGLKVSNPLLQLLKPYAIDDSNLSYLKVNDQYTATIHIDYFGKDYLEDLALWPLLTLEYDYDLSVHLIPLNKTRMLEEYARRKTRIGMDYKEKLRKMKKHEAEVARDKAEREIGNIEALEQDLKTSKQLVWSTSIDITFRAPGLDELERIKEAVKRKLTSREIIFSEATGSHYEGFLSTAPFMVNLVAGYNRPFPRLVKLSKEVSHFYPFCPMAIENNRGMMLGVAVQ